MIFRFIELFATLSAVGAAFWSGWLWRSGASFATHHRSLTPGTARPAAVPYRTAGAMPERPAVRLANNLDYLRVIGLFCKCPSCGRMDQHYGALEGVSAASVRRKCRYGCKIDWIELLRGDE